MAPRRNKDAERNIAEERIERLFKSAYSIHKTNTSLSSRYVILAGKIAMKYRVKIPDQYRHSYCRKCHSFFSPGKNTRTRITKGKVTITCMNCGYIRRYPAKEKI